MAQYREYERPSVTSGGCSYATLAGYNQGYYGKSILAPVPSAVQSSEIIVPSYGQMGYQVLTHGSYPTCAGYFGIQNAYPRFPNNCNKFTSRLCG